jgi:glutamate-ammonia-ligase adenylyltransferase
MHLISPLPADWQDDFSRMLDSFRDALTSEQLSRFNALLTDNACKASLAQVWLGSQYAFSWSCREPDWLLQLISGHGEKQPDHNTLHTTLLVLLNDVADETALLHCLRRFRQKTMLWIIWRDFTRRATTLETTAALSALADVCIQQAVEFHYPRLCMEAGTPCNEQGVPQTLLVLAMGKLGAHELNLSSDIDLIFSYNDSGETLFNGQRAPRSVSNRDFFQRLGQRLITALDKKTADGFVFRVDMRLRPYGDSGALALNYDAMEQYYQQQGRDWERYAMIKARLVCGDPQQASPLLDMLRRFTFRRYLDFSAIAALRDLKRQIERDVAKKGMQDNIKLGWGGIREIEFIVQSFQLIHGGRDRDLQPAPVIPMIEQLTHKGCLTDEDAAQLRGAYFFLRDVEHLIQGWNDEQTQMLPKDLLRQARMAWLMGFETTPDFDAALRTHREHIQRIFAAVIAPAPDELAKQEDTGWQSLWEQQAEPEVMIEQLTASGLPEADHLQPLLQAWRDDKILLTLPNEGRERLSRFMPLLLKELAACETPAVTFERLLPLLRAVLRRSAYLVLLIENPQALKQLVLLVEASSWIAEQLAAAPVLLDELIDPRNLYRDIAPSRELLRELLLAQVQHIPEDDLESQMEALRHFKRSHSLRAAACEITGRLSLMKVSDYLTFMAEVILDYVLTLCWRTLLEKHGQPQREDGTRCNPGFIIVGYGKLGGIELGHGSDLDLVFIHNAGSGNTATDKAGQTPIENGMFFTRLGQKIIHVLNTRTVNGILYEVDMRLRPSGNSGLLVATLNSFERYQDKDAWTWEHQALVRTRVVAGCPELAHAFASVRANILSRTRDISKLKQDVVEMRQKMRAQLDTSDSTHFDLKQGEGGIVDLEFLVQYAVLAWSHTHADLLTWSDNIRILEQMVVAGLLPAADASSLMEAYRRLRAQGHRCVLLGLPGKLPDTGLSAERNTIHQVWQRMLGPES